MGWCRNCNHSAMKTQPCYNRRTMQVLIRYTCIVCGHIEYGQDSFMDTNGYEHPIFMPWEQWVSNCRQEDYHYLALVRI